MRNRSPLAAAVGDLAEGVRLSPLWWRLGLEATYNRYRRTILGPFWIASAMLATGLSMAFVFGSLMGGDWRETLPHILAGVLCWSLVSGAVTDGVGVYTGSVGMMQAQRLPLSFYAMLNSNKLVVNFVHQIVAFWGVMLLFRLFTVPHWTALLAIPLVAVTGFLISIPVGMISARYRDVGFLISTAFGAMFLLTPVFWNRAQLSPDKRWIADYNPFAHLLEIIRQPFMGQPAPLLNWYASLGVLVVAAVIAVFSIAMFRKRVIFWL
jgi:ABC-type polysaccharide/polyol phosphate export permease